MKSITLLSETMIKCRDLYLLVLVLLLNYPFISLCLNKSCTFNFNALTQHLLIIEYNEKSNRHSLILRNL